jgi:hypothetical protein
MTSLAVGQQCTLEAQHPGRVSFRNGERKLYGHDIAAMPFGMGSMMRFMGQRTPFMLGAMKPVFPILFPLLLPMMMPKVMDNLMPHMLPDVVPLVTGPMIEYLKN